MSDAQLPSDERVAKTKELIDERDSEFTAIADMIDAGNENGLLIELIWSFGQARLGGDSVEQAVGHACTEWDV